MAGFVFLLLLLRTVRFSTVLTFVSDSGEIWILKARNEMPNKLNLSPKEILNTFYTSLLIQFSCKTYNYISTILIKARIKT